MYPSSSDSIVAFARGPQGPPGDATTADISAAIDALKNGVDPAGDTLAELYALILARATLNALSAFTVSPTVPTLAPGNNSTKVANSAFLQQELTNALTNYLSLGGGTLVGPLILAADPVAGLGAATKQYVDAFIQGISAKYSAYAATTTTLPSYTYSNGTAGVGATITATANGALSIDGQSPAASVFVLIKNETAGNAPYNGLYSVTQAGDGSHPFILTRAVDDDTAAEMAGAFCFIELGTLNNKTGWICGQTGITIGTTAITFTQFSGVGTYSAGTGLSLTGSQFAVKTGNSVADPGTGNLEAMLPILTTAGASKVFVTADLFKEHRRSNAGSALTDTFPAAAATGMANGARITYNNVDATATSTITAGAGTTMSSGGATDTVGPGRSIQYVYDLASTQWRKTLNTGTALLGPNNLSDVSSASTSRTNLGLGNVATQNSGTGLGNSGSNLNLQPAALATIGGVQAVNAVSHQWIVSINTSGVPQLSQPSVSDLSTGTAPAFTFGGNVAGGGFGIDNAVIGGSTPLAGTFTTLKGNTSTTTPTVIGGSGAGATLTLQSTSNGSASGDVVTLATGNNGAKSTLRATQTGVGINTNGNPIVDLQVGGAGGSNTGFEISVAGTVTAQAYNRNTSNYTVLTFAGSTVNFQSGSSGSVATTLSLGAASIAVTGALQTKQGAVTLANGLNSNISTPAASWVRITGPSGAFSVGGLTGGVDGYELEIFNTTAQTMTIKNEDASSTAGNRITTLTGADVVLRATATSAARFRYDATNSRWILVSTN